MAYCEAFNILTASATVNVRNAAVTAAHVPATIPEMVDALLNALFL